MVLFGLFQAASRVKARAWSGGPCGHPVLAHRLPAGGVLVPGGLRVNFNAIGDSLYDSFAWRGLEPGASVYAEGRLFRMRESALLAPEVQRDRFAGLNPIDAEVPPIGPTLLLIGHRF